MRSTNNPVADYAEYLVVKALRLTLVANSSIGFDAISEGGTRYQVRARPLTARNSSRQLGFIRGLDAGGEPFDLLAGVLSEADFLVRRGALVPLAVVRDRAARVDYVNAWRVVLNEATWDLPGVEDITEQLRKWQGARRLV